MGGGCRQAEHFSSREKLYVNAIIIFPHWKFISILDLMAEPKLHGFGDRGQDKTLSSGLPATVLESKSLLPRILCIGVLT